MRMKHRRAAKIARPLKMTMARSPVPKTGQKDSRTAAAARAMGRGKRAATTRAAMNQRKMPMSLMMSRMGNRGKAKIPLNSPCLKMRLPNSEALK